MYQKLLRDVSFYDLLFRFDEDLAERIRALRCPCGGSLHRAHYRRKPRGGPADVSRGASLRLSYCCSVAGCRRRRTPPSLRFLDRKVYFSVVVLLVPVLRRGPDGDRLRRLQDQFQVSARTVRRWQRWWREDFGGSSAMTRWQGLSAAPILRQDLPGSLLEVFASLATVRDRVLAVLRALSNGHSVQVW